MRQQKNENISMTLKFRMAELLLYPQDMVSKDISSDVLIIILKNWYFLIVPQQNKYTI